MESMCFEGRKAARLCESHPMLVKRVSDGLEGFVKTGDLSLGGLAFESVHPLKVGTELEILLCIEKRVVKASAQVMRSSERHSGRYAVGVRFTRIGAREKNLLRCVMELEGLLDFHPERGCRAAA